MILLGVEQQATAEGRLADEPGAINTSAEGIQLDDASPSPRQVAHADEGFDLQTVVANDPGSSRPTASQASRA